MTVNFKTREINRGVHKLVRISTLIKNKAVTSNKAFRMPQYIYTFFRQHLLNVFIE